MKQITGYFHISVNSFDEFNKRFKENINILNEDNQEIEVQYNTQVVNNPTNPILYSVLIIGRK